MRLNNVQKRELLRNMVSGDNDNFLLHKTMAYAHIVKYSDKEFKKKVRKVVKYYRDKVLYNLYNGSTDPWKAEWERVLMFRQPSQIKNK